MGPKIQTDCKDDGYGSLLIFRKGRNYFWKYILTQRDEREASELFEGKGVERVDMVYPVKPSKLKALESIILKYSKELGETGNVAETDKFLIKAIDKKLLSL